MTTEYHVDDLIYTSLPNLLSDGWAEDKNVHVFPDHGRDHTTTVAELRAEENLTAFAYTPDNARTVVVPELNHEQLADQILAAIQSAVDDNAGFAGARFSLNGTGWEHVAREAVVAVLRDNGIQSGLRLP